MPTVHVMLWTIALCYETSFIPFVSASGLEAGGRIFHPIKPKSEDGLTFQPVAFDGANQEDLALFGIWKI
jgi:hypothetical protein